MAGLDQVADDEPIGQSPLSIAGGGDFFHDAVRTLREQSSDSAVDPAMLMAQAAGEAPLTKKQIFDKMQPKIDAASAAGRNAVGVFNNPGMNDWIPWLRGASGFMAPTKTGSFGESMGHGLGEYAAGLDEQQKLRIASQQHGAELGYNVAKGDATETSNMLRLGLNADQITAAMKLAEQRFGQGMYNTPAIKEWAFKHGYTIAQIMAGAIKPEDKKDFDNMLVLARGSTGMKDALTASGMSGLNPGNPLFAKLTAAYGNQKMVTQAWNQARTMVPREQYIGMPQEEYEKAVTDQFHRIIHSYVQNPELAGGAGAASAPPPAAAPAGGPGAPAAPPGPGAAATASSPAPAAGTASGAFKQPLDSGAAKPTDFVSHVVANSKAWQQNPAIVQDAKSREHMDQEAMKEWGTAQSDVGAGEEMVAAANQLDAINPRATPVAGLVAALGRYGSVLGLGPDNDLVKNAAKYDTAQKIVEQLRNSVLLKHKGVQTEGDANRAMEQIAHLKDMPEVFDAAKAYMRGLGQKIVDKADFYQHYAEKNAGQATGANVEWARQAMNVPIFVKVTFKDGSPGYLTYKEFIDQHVKAGDTVEEAIKQLRAKAYGRG